MHDQDDASDEPSLASNRVLEIAVASCAWHRDHHLGQRPVGDRLGRAKNPPPSSVPIAVLLGAGASPPAQGGLGRQVTAVIRFAPGVHARPTVLIPAIFYVAAVQFIGFYAAPGLFLLFSMLFAGGESLLRSIAVGAAVPLFFFAMFEKWFLVPLPKGPIENMLGF